VPATQVPDAPGDDEGSNAISHELGSPAVV